MRKKKWPPTLQDRGGYARAKHPATGKYESFGPSGPEANARYLEWLADLEATGNKPAATRRKLSLPTVADVLARWWEAHKDSLHPKENGNYDVTIRALTRTHGALLAESLDVCALEEFRQAILTGSWITPKERKERKGGNGFELSAKTANHRITRVRTIWRWAETKNLVPKDSWKHLASLKPLAVPRRKPRSSKYEDILKVGEHCPGPVGVMLELQYWTGMRPAEVCTLRTCDLDSSGGLWVYSPQKHKNAFRGHDRQIVFGADAQRLVTPWLKPEAAEEYLFVPTDRHGRYRDRYTDETYARAVQRACKKAGVKITPYGSRHAAKDWITRQFGLDHARAALGHATLGTTAHEYGTAVDLEMAKDVFRKKDAG